MDNFYSEIYSRNIGILSESEQEKLRSSTIAIAGVGGVGGLLAERLVRIGIGRLKITDPGTFEKSNFNRQFGSSITSLGYNKAEIVFNQIKDINPQAKIDYSTAGIINESDAIRFVSDSDLVIDEMDFGLFRQSISLQRAARNRGIHYFFTSAIGFGAMIVIFGPRGLTLEEYDNLPPDVDLNGIEELHVPLERVLPILPSYIPAATHEAYRTILGRERPGPTISIGVGLASILAANEAINIILKKREIATAPRYTYIDLLDQRFTLGTVP
ncbi:MAG TPA: ThiF family adenylyltransferase [Dehalococcoidales bacterium]